MTIVETVDVVVGVDTHRDTHTAAICDERGKLLAELVVETNPAGYAQLWGWVSEAAEGVGVVWAIEGTRHYGVGLARFLVERGACVEEIDSTRHVGKHRKGKSDPIDALRAARELLARPQAAVMRADGDREALRLLMIERDHTVDGIRVARTVLTSLIVTAPTQLREQLRDLSARRRAQVCAGLVCPTDADRLTRVAYQSLIHLGGQIVELVHVAADLETQIAEIVEDLAPGVVAAEAGVGALSLAQILLSWSHAGRVRSEAAFAMLSGTAPVPVSSGRTDRHRLNRMGDRQLNRAFHTVAVSKMRSDPDTLAYVARRRAEGKTDREIRRCLKRYLARHLYRVLNALDRT